MSKTRILIVEDELILARDISHQLTRLGYEPAGSTARGDEVLSLAEQLRPDLVLMDIELDGPIDGVEAARSLREIHRIPVIFLTALAGDSVLARAKMACPYGYIMKPFEQSELHTTIEVALNLHHSEMRLRSSQARARMLTRAVEQSPASIVVTNADGAIEYVNPCFTRVTGYAAAEVIGQNPRLLKSGRQTPEFYESMWRTISGGSEWSGEFHNRRKDGTLFWEHASISPLRDDDGTISHFVAVKEDITARKQAEQRLLEARAALEATNAELEASIIQARDLARAAEAANQAKGAFLAAMSHELRTPLNVINGVSATLLEQDPTETQRNALELIHHSGEDLLAIIEKILDFTRLQAGRITLDEVPCELAPTIFHALRLAVERASGRGLDIRCTIAPSVPARLVMDARKVGQVLINLLGNAVKFTEYGHVELQVEAYPQDPDMWRLEFLVRDTGIGIDAGTLKHLFQPFAQADGSITRRYGGSGLGLAISRSLAQLMAGDVTAESTPRQGSTFRFTMCARATDDRRSLMSAGRLPALTGKRALVAAAHPSHASYFGTLMLNWGLECTVLESGLALPGLYGTGQRFDVVVVESDALPAGLRAHWDRVHIAEGNPPVVWVSADRTSARTPGEPRACHLPWPVAPDELKRSLIELLHPAPAPKPAPHTRDLLGKRIPLRILAADDVRINREVLRMILTHLGYSPEFAENGAEVLDALERRDFDLVLLDVQMPVMDGLTAAREICRRYPHATTRPRMVAITANAMPESRAECLAAGMDDYLAKPVIPRQLETCLIRLFQPAGPTGSNPPATPPADAARSPRWIDTEHLEAITFSRCPAETAGLIGQLVTSFEADFHGLMPRLRQACVNRDPKAAALLVHGLKGGALTLGWTHFADGCIEALDALRGGRFASWDSLCADLERWFFESRHAVNAFLREPPSAPPPAAEPTSTASEPGLAQGAGLAVRH